MDRVEQAGFESFPASDPPSFTPVIGSVPHSPTFVPSDSQRSIRWLQGALSWSGEQHLVLMQMRDFLGQPDGVQPAQEESRVDLVARLERAYGALFEHRQAMASSGDLCETIDRDCTWLRTRLARLLMRHTELEAFVRGILAKLDRWPPSGSEEFSSEVVRAELQVTAALLNDVLMEEYFLEQATFDSPPALD